MISIEEIWLATEPLDMRTGPDTALDRVVRVFGEAKPHCAYLFANKRGNRMRVLVHDGFGLWLEARRLHTGHFIWGKPWMGKQVALSPEQLQALVVGLPWQHVGRDHRAAIPQSRVAEVLVKKFSSLSAAESRRIFRCENAARS